MPRLSIRGKKTDKKDAKWIRPVQAWSCCFVSYRLADIHWLPWPYVTVSNRPANQAKRIVCRTVPRFPHSVLGMPATPFGKFAQAILDNFLENLRRYILTLNPLFTKVWKKLPGISDVIDLLYQLEQAGKLKVINLSLDPEQSLKNHALAPAAPISRESFVIPPNRSLQTCYLSTISES